MSRHQTTTRDDRLDALFACPLIHDLAHDLGNLTRRPRRHPVAFHLAFGAMSRLYGSANRASAELANPTTWTSVRDRYNTGAGQHPNGRRLEANQPLHADTYRHFRDHLTRDDNLDAFADAFTRHAVAIANHVGLLVVDGAGSRTRPHPSRTIYGDGTIVRPLCRAEPTSTTQSSGSTGRIRRHDPDAATHRRHDGAIWGNNLVTIATRGSEANRRVILAVGRVDQPGREAATAVELIGNVVSHGADGIQAIVYDGAFRGVHHDTIMRDFGLIVINKVHADTRTDETTATYRTVSLGHWTHLVGRRDCTHHLVAHRGAVYETTLDDTGTPTLIGPFDRHQIRRYATSGSRYRFTLGVTITCPKKPFVAWISPHRQRGDTSHTRPDQLRLIHETDPDFPALYGLRNDAEAINSSYKRTLIADRAAALGWRRQVIDLLSWGILTNTLAWHCHPRTPATPRGLHDAAPPSLSHTDDQHDTTCQPNA
jgi:hypothetical protein